MAACRQAIDATLSAYHIIKSPDSAALYLKGHKTFQFIKSTILKAVTKDPSAFPLASDLIKMHELCSRFSHSDFATLSQKVEVSLKEDAIDVRLFFFHRWSSTTEFSFFLSLLLLTFWHCCRVFTDALKAKGHTTPADFDDFGKYLFDSYLSLREKYLKGKGSNDATAD